MLKNTCAALEPPERVLDEERVCKGVGIEINIWNIDIFGFLGLYIKENLENCSEAGD